ncbi:DUF1588 domain-containing protein [Vulgatibacter incomptus]|uniref:Cellulose-binding domain protein n=1 Tax=Vulgatibacter incomptus TaxID=1391653 RepID=A0A0K1PF11_9BACT|nr:DUF1588 domain-containing protein [Vulgatibacter incomptus]AKU92006.1 hypothetical protein AKJ08_2393 [Vulgatibacter incomptus]
MRHGFLRTTALALAAALIGACGSDKSGGDEECLSNDRFFAKKVWAPILSEKCYACHNSAGQANKSNMVLQPATQTGFMEANFAKVAHIASYEIRGTSLLLLKPSNQIEHGGGLQIAKDGPEYKALQELIGRLANPVTCGSPDLSGFYRGLDILDARSTLRKAALAIVGRLPTEEEDARVATVGESAIESIVDEMMTEESFFDRLKVAFNDRLLTDRYVLGNRAVDLLDAADFPNRRWHVDLDEATTDPELFAKAKRWTNESVAREPLELVAHVVRNDRPFGEILTADYRLVNPFSAKVYGMDDLRFKDPLDPREWREGRLKEGELAGVLGSPMFLNRFPTTSTNRNRKRARMVYQFFLATDLLKLAERPVDPTSIEDFNPTMYNPNCTVCHNNMDPVAGAFQNWDERGRYRPPADGWHKDMLPPGFKDRTIPFEQRRQSLPWLGKEIAADPLFATSTVYTAYTMLTGQAPLTPPADPLAPDYELRQDAYEAQNELFKEIATAFTRENQNFKGVVKRLVMSPWFRAYNVMAGKEEAFDDVGTARFLGPEQLNAKIWATTGFPWRVWGDTPDYLTDRNQYLIFYGGIDSEAVTDRISAPNGVMANVAQRMANEVACWFVPWDLTAPAHERKLLPLVELGYEPEDANGFEIPGAVDAIRENIRYLHQRLLGETLPVGDPELERSYRLFVDTWRDGRDAVAKNAESRWLPGNCRANREFWTREPLPDALKVEDDSRYTIRAWMAVTTYLLSDYKFLHE